MANTFTSLHYHIVFSTKGRETWIQPQHEERIWAYLGGIAKSNKMHPLQHSVVATRRIRISRFAVRGLKPTATLMSSLRDEDKAPSPRGTNQG